MYPLFRTPELNLSESEQGLQVVLGNGFDLFEQRLPLGTPQEEVILTAEATLLMLACRQYFNPIPYLQPAFDEGEKIRLTLEGTARIRKVAFLRRNVKYALRTLLSKMIGNGKAFKEFNSKVNAGLMETFYMNSGKIVVSLDSALAELPEVFHPDLLANARTAEPKYFSMDELYEIADAAHIVVGGPPCHPLELKPSRVVVAPANPGIMLTNNLPEPPLILVADEAESKFPIVAIHNMKQRLRKSAEADRFKVGDEVLTRFQFMEYLCWCVSEGNKLSKLCTGLNGTPTMIEVGKWRQWHPDFDHDLQVAEKIRATVDADNAREVVDNAMADKDELARARFQYKAYMELAALGDEKFRQKQIIQTEDLNKKDEVEIKRQLVMMLQNNPKILDILKNKSQPQVINAEP